ncbi:MetQ/NlpA family ABC transporter substrate-binding protein [Trichococcus sp.]|uniref:MetQ/NlpA family ABC transporter substrate-binding protein n=1 Tax=Trichococcus sp. TaxID=1985464 RepID=UPI003C7C77D0
MKNKTFLATLTLSASLFLAACGSAASDSSSSDVTSAEATEPVKVTLGVVGEVNEPWDYVIEELKEKENIEVEMVKFTDYTTPNNALAEGEIDLSSFQTEIFMDNYNKDHGTELTTIGYTVMAPLGLYSEKITDISELKDGDTIAIPNDVSNEGRALILLQTAGLITLDPEAGLVPTTEDVVENRLNLQFQTLESNQTARALQDVTASVINSGMAVDAGFIPSEDAVFLEPVTEDSKPYYNVIAALSKDVDNEVFQTIVKYYQSEGTAKVIEESSKGSQFPVWDEAK